jgi:seryl-tRNA synthetase
MQRTLQEHLDELHARRKELSADISRSFNRSEANRIESELRAVEMAIKHFEAAIKIEQSLSK